MEKLFGIPISTLTATLTVVFVLAMAVTAFMAARNPVILKMAIRNIPRRRAQTVLIVFGLMLATLLFSASFGTGDTLAHSIRARALSEIGQVDEYVFSAERGASGQPRFLSSGTLEAVRLALQDAPIDGITPLVAKTAPAVAVESQRSEPRLGIQGFDPSLMEGFDRYFDQDGTELDLDDLGSREAYLSTNAADQMGVSAGDQVALFFEETPSVIDVVGVFARGGNTSSINSAVMRLSDLQEVIGEPGRFNAMFVSNEGGLVSGESLTDEVVSALEEVLELEGLDLEETKRDALEQADQVGGAFTSIFLVFGTFSILAGILLISLIFVMLAAERKRELGIARAVGAQRGHIVRLFTFEGAVYSLAAAAVGSLLGVVVGMIMVRIMAQAFGSLDDFDLQLQFAFRWQSLLLAYTLGMVVTYAVVVISAARVSALNIVRAVRDIPEPLGEDKRIVDAWRSLLMPIRSGAKELLRMHIHRALRYWLLTTPMGLLRLAWVVFLKGYLMVILGVQQLLAGINQEQLALFLIGFSFILVGVPLILKHALKLPQRAAYTSAGTLLVVLWIVPWDWEDFGLPKFQEGLEIFILSGVMLVIGAVWVVMYNSHYLVALATAMTRRGRTLAPIMRTATAYPMATRLRTGMTLAMFSLVIFTLIVLGFVTSAFSAAFGDTKRLSGGFDITSTVGFTNPIGDLSGAIAASPNLSAVDYTAIGGLSGLPVRIRQDATEQQLQDWFVTGVDESYANTVTYDFKLKDDRYPTARDVWRALITEKNVAVVSAEVVASTADYDFEEETEFQLEGFKREDAELPDDIFLEVFDSAEEKMISLRVIGMVEEQAFFANSVIAGKASLQRLSEVDLPLLWYQIELADPSRAEELATALETEFVQHGMQADSLERLVRGFTSLNLTFNRLIQGFMGLGLIVGIAALGVIAARSVVERRVQIGVLRAIGFTRGMVQLSFLIESSFIALLGIILGLGLGFGLSLGIISQIAEEFEGVSYRVPWLTVGLVIVVAYGASLLTTYLPARQASRIYPAEALRLDE